jgi:hypothetical protein
MDFSKSVLTNSRKISSANRNPPALARAQKSQRLFIGRQVFIALLANAFSGADFETYSGVGRRPFMNRRLLLSDGKADGMRGAK